MEKQLLVITEKFEGGEWLAVTRLLEALKKKQPSVIYRYLVLKKRKESKKSMSFMPGLFDYFFKARIEINKCLTASNIDYILVSDYLWALAALSIRNKRAKSIFLFHGLRSVPFKKLSDINYRQLLIKILERFSWLFSDAIVSPAASSGQYLLKSTCYLLSKKKMFVVPNIVPAIFFVKTRPSVKNGRFNIIYSGRIASYKGLTNIIIAFSGLLSEIPSARLTLAAPSQSIEKDLYNDLVRKIRSYNIQAKVKFVMDNREPELLRLYVHSDVLLVASEIEFAPLSVLEAFASGTLVVGTDVGNIGEHLRRIDPDLILKDNSPKEIKDKLRLLYKYNSTRKNHLRRVAYALAKNFSEANAVSSFSKVLSFLGNNISR